MLSNLLPNPYAPYILNNGPDFIPADEVAIIVPKYNTTKPDATGAFHPEAINFCEYWNLPRNRILYVDNKLPKNVKRERNVADDFLSKMESIQESNEAPIAIWVLFCHGYTHGIQFSIRSKNHKFFNPAYEEKYESFINIISEHPSPLIALYACSTGDDPEGNPDTAPGSGDGSFADMLRDDLCRTGCVYSRVMSHTTAGHTTHNPFIKLFDGNGSAIGGEGGELIARPGSKKFRNLRKLLKTDFRFKIPFMTNKSIQKEIK
jgi:hypothetical protein